MPDPVDARPYSSATQATTPAAFTFADLDRVHKMLREIGTTFPEAGSVILSAPNKWTMDRGGPDVGTTDPPSTLPMRVSFSAPIPGALRGPSASFLVLDDVPQDIGLIRRRAEWPMLRISNSERGRYARAAWGLRIINGLDAQRARDLAERDAIRAWLRADRTRDGERVLPLP